MNEKEKKITEKGKKLLSTFKLIFIITFGILLPILTLGIEFFSGMCADSLFDPIPTLGHTLAVAFVPLINSIFLAFFFLETKDTNKLNFFLGISLAISSFYSLLFITALPIAIFALLFFGLGFLPLSPLLSLIASLLCINLNRKKQTRSLKNLLIMLLLGFMTGSLFIATLELPKTITRYGMSLAVTGTEEQNKEGIKFLRKYGDSNVILRSCYRFSGETTDFLTTFLFRRQAVYPDQARNLYYQVTGREFNSVPKPNMERRIFSDFNEFDFDSREFSSVGAKLKSLTLNDSRLDSIIDQKSGTFYTEWTMNFKNKAIFQQEAKAEIKLPANSTVSRITLWVNGEEREGVFAGKDEVKEAYNKIVSKARDPLLVSYNGNDRIFVQCFPVPPNGGQMKIKIGITSQLTFENDKLAYLSLPKILDNNFTVGKEAKHAFWLDSKEALALEGNENLKLTQEKSVYTIRGYISNDELLSKQPVIKLVSSNAINNSWLEDKNDPTYAITQSIKKENEQKVKRIIIAIDGSYAMQNYIEDISKALKKLPDNIEVLALLAGNEVIDLSNGIKLSSPRTTETILNNLKQHNFYGGFENIELLDQAIKNISQEGTTEIIWLHGLQPNFINSIGGFYQYFDRKKPNNIEFYEMQFGEGTDSISSNLPNYIRFNSIPEIGSYQNSLEKFFSNLNKKENITFIREKVAKNILDTKIFNETNKASIHLAKLWAYNEVLAKLSNTQKDPKTLEIAWKYQVVTPISGAVVLENNQQYKDFGLDKNQKHSASTTIPIIPEPEEWLLIIITMFLLVFVVFKRRKNAQLFN